MNAIRSDHEEPDKLDFLPSSSQPISRPVTLIREARLPRKSLLWDLHIANGTIQDILPHDSNSTVHAPDSGTLGARGRLVAPSLCHAHIHLDKCFLLQDHKFSDLQIVKGDFKEAMSLTSEAKARFSTTDLLRRGRQLIEESIAAGVTAMRAFVEVDTVVQLKCIEAGTTLRKEFCDRCIVQIVAFAQLPLFSGSNAEDNRRLMEEAASIEDISVLGSTPYVEDDDDKQKLNVHWIASLALRTNKLLDLHLDYFVDVTRQPLIWNVVDILAELDWNTRSGNANVVLGHCTRLTLFDNKEWKSLKKRTNDLSLHFIGLPTSDLFMMRTENQYRGSLHIPKLVHEYGLNAAVAINNVGNAFTPQGNCDPLSVASLGIGLYSAGTTADAELLYVRTNSSDILAEAVVDKQLQESVSSRAKAAISINDAPTLDIHLGAAADLVIFPADACKWRTRKSIAEVVYDPPSCAGRIVIKAGQVISGVITPMADM